MGDKLKFERPKKNFSVINKSVSTAEIDLYGPIGGYWYDAITLNDISNALKDLPETVNTIELRVNSPGGDVFEGISIYNRLKSHKAKVIAYVDGMAASIASIIIQAADEIVMGDGAEIMVHKPLSFTYGNASDLENVIQRLDEVEERLLSIYQKATGIDRTELRGMLADETYMDADQAIEKGFASRKMDSESESVAMVACLDFEQFKWIKKSPVRNLQNDITKNKLDNIINDLKL
jgi:ATP-dependent protease ClpP protease subunit